ncbi:MAG: hypothetical protein ACYDEQ_09010 [Desulfocucumaceae bacterium]
MFLSCFVAFADIATLKSGKSVQGKLIQATDEHIEIYFPGYLVLEVAYFKLQKFNETIEISRQALKIDPDDLISDIYIAPAYKNAGQKEQVRTYFKKAVSLLDR